jgi:ribosome biogenesis protein BRX1
MIWVRNYQILDQPITNAREAHVHKKQKKTETAAGAAAAATTTSTSLIEIGPRFVLHPIRIFRGGAGAGSSSSSGSPSALFGGQTIFQDPAFVSPNAIRAAQRRDKGNVYSDRKLAQSKRKEHVASIAVPDDPLDHVFD